MTLTLEICRASNEPVEKLGAENRTVHSETHSGDTMEITRQFCTVDDLEELLEAFEDGVVINHPTWSYTDMDVDYYVTVYDSYLE